MGRRCKRKTPITGAGAADRGVGLNAMATTFEPWVRSAWLLFRSYIRTPASHDRGRGGGAAGRDCTVCRQPGAHAPIPPGGLRGLQLRVVASMKKYMGNWGPRSGIDELVSFSIENLPTMRLSSGLYCYDMPFSTRQRRGESVRYSLIVLLGLQRAASGGRGRSHEIEELWESCLSRRNAFTPGDIGLALWADARRDG